MIKKYNTNVKCSIPTPIISHKMLLLNEGMDEKVFADNTDIRRDSFGCNCNLSIVWPHLDPFDLVALEDLGSKGKGERRKDSVL